MSEKHDRMAEILKQCAAEFISREAQRTALITVTGINLAKSQYRAVVFISVYPENKAAGALDFLKRHRSDFKKYAQEHTKLKRLPNFDFAIDQGEKNRQHIDELLQN